MTSIPQTMESYIGKSTVIITCGWLEGTLHLNKFFCPAIHCACIELDDGQIITPKMFCIKGDKAKLKDWKNAIRVNGIPMRKLIDAGLLDFYRHAEFCTGRCTPRHPVNRCANISSIAPEANATTVTRPASGNGTPTVVRLGSSTEQRLSSSTIKRDVPVDIADTLYHRLVCPGPQEESSESRATTYTVKSIQTSSFPWSTSQSVSSWGSAAASTSRMQSSLGEPPRLKVSSHSANSESDDDVETVMVKYTQLSDDQQFWLGILENNLCDDFFQDIHMALEKIKTDLITYCVRETDAYCLSNIVRELGLMTAMKNKLTALKSDTDQQQRALENELQELRKKMAEYKAHKRVLKRKSQKFDNLIAVTKAKKRKVVKVVHDPEDALLCDSSLDDSSDEQEMEDNLPRKLQRQTSSEEHAERSAEDIAEEETEHAADSCSSRSDKVKDSAPVDANHSQPCVCTSPKVKEEAVSASVEEMNAPEEPSADVHSDGNNCQDETDSSAASSDKQEHAIADSEKADTASTGVDSADVNMSNDVELNCQDVGEASEKTEAEEGSNMNLEGEDVAGTGRSSPHEKHLSSPPAKTAEESENLKTTENQADDEIGPDPKESSVDTSLDSASHEVDKNQSENEPPSASSADIPAISSESTFGQTSENLPLSPVSNTTGPVVLVEKADGNDTCFDRESVQADSAQNSDGTTLTEHASGETQKPKFCRLCGRERGTCIHAGVRFKYSERETHKPTEIDCTEISTGTPKMLTRASPPAKKFKVAVDVQGKQLPVVSYRQSAVQVSAEKSAATQHTSSYLLLKTQAGIPEKRLKPASPNDKASDSKRGDVSTNIKGTPAGKSQESSSEMTGLEGNPKLSSGIENPDLHPSSSSGDNVAPGSIQTMTVQVLLPKSQAEKKDVSSSEKPLTVLIPSDGSLPVSGLVGPTVSTACTVRLTTLNNPAVTVSSSKTDPQLSSNRSKGHVSDASESASKHETSNKNVDAHKAYTIQVDSLQSLVSSMGKRSFDDKTSSLSVEAGEMTGDVIRIQGRNDVRLIRVRRSSDKLDKDVQASTLPLPREYTDSKKNIRKDRNRVRDKCESPKVSVRSVQTKTAEALTSPAESQKSSPKSQRKGSVQCSVSPQVSGSAKGANASRSADTTDRQAESGTDSRDNTPQSSRRSGRRQSQLPAKFRGDQFLLPKKYAGSAIENTSGTYEDM